MHVGDRRTYFWGCHSHKNAYALHDVPFGDNNKVLFYSRKSRRSRSLLPWKQYLKTIAFLPTFGKVPALPSPFSPSSHCRLPSLPFASSRFPSGLFHYPERSSPLDLFLPYSFPILSCPSFLSPPPSILRSYPSAPPLSIPSPPLLLLTSNFVYFLSTSPTSHAPFKLLHPASCDLPVTDR